MTPGQYKLYTDVAIENLITSISEEAIYLSVYPNPSNDVLRIDSDLEIQSVHLINMQGAIVPLRQLDGISWDVSTLANGMYVAEIKLEGGIVKKRFLKK
jgi:hypothetical protein